MLPIITEAIILWKEQVPITSGQEWRFQEHQKVLSLKKLYLFSKNKREDIFLYRKDNDSALMKVQMRRFFCS